MHLLHSQYSFSLCSSNQTFHQCFHSKKVSQNISHISLFYCCQQPHVCFALWISASLITCSIQHISSSFSSSTYQNPYHNLTANCQSFHNLQICWPNLVPYYNPLCLQYYIPVSQNILHVDKFIPYNPNSSNFLVTSSIFTWLNLLHIHSIAPIQFVYLLLSNEYVVCLPLC